VTSSGSPETDVARVQQWCRDRVPDAARHEVRIECEVSDRDLTIVECRSPWAPEVGSDWTRSPVARMRYVTSRGVWTLYWRDSDGSWHVYREVPPTASIDRLLGEVDRDPTAIFWG
jgi:hypothetical protein